ncbi:MAG: ribonuclease III [Oscillatoria sp. SIO1A7]|nr:ribonuclease III [Oscillatoria sp. SIO1A7]
MTLTYPHRQQQLEKLVLKLGLAKQSALQWKLLDLALTHPTSSSDANYEQLEFVGDAAIRLAAAEFLFENYPDIAVGEYAAIRSILVSDRVLARIADSYGLERYLLVAPSAQNAAGEQSRLADALEATIGALYLSTHTLKLIRPWLDGHFQQLTREIRSDPALGNYKQALQEWTQNKYKILPEYRVQTNKPGDREGKQFAAEVWIKGQLFGSGCGRTKKDAQQAAARIAFLSLHKNN